MTDHPIKTDTPETTDVNATKLLIDTDALETMTRARGHDLAAEVLTGGGNRERVVQALNIQHTAALDHLLLNGVEMHNQTTRVLIVDMVVDMAVDMAVEAQTI